MSCNPTHYDVLGVPRDADQAAIRKAYLRASLRCHPDKNPGREEAAKVEFVKVGQAYAVLGDATNRAAYDRELRLGKGRPTFTTRPQRPAKTTATDAGFDDDAAKQQADKDFDTFMDMFDQTVSGMSEEELNMAMGAAAMVGSIIGSIAGARAAKGGNSFLASAASMVGSAIASQAASSLVQTVHEDSKQRVLEKEERAAAIARGEQVPERSSRDSRERVMKDAGRAFQKMAGAAAGVGSGVSSSNGRTSANVKSFGANDNATTSSNGGGGGKSQFNWRQAAKIAVTVAGACAEMQQCGSDSNKNRR